MFKLVKRNKIAVAVKGALPDEDGKPVKFDFKLHCKRYTQDQIDAVMKDRETDIKSFIREAAEGWDGVLTETGAVVDFGAAELDEVIDNPGMPMLIFQSYLGQVAATAKN